MKQPISSSKKTKAVQAIINEALDILALVGIPFGSKTERALERMAMCFLAVAGVTKNWKMARENANLKSRDIISFINENFEENISSGSHDNIRRKDLKFLVLADLIVNSGASKGAATNNPTRGYALHPDFKNLVVKYKTDSWEKSLKAFNSKRPSLADILARKRNVAKIPVRLPSGKPLHLSLGKHNELQKAVVEEFLPRFARGCEVLYIGDTSNKALHVEEAALQDLHFFELSHNELPDIVAFSRQNGLIFLVEAVHSSGTMSETRVLELKKMLVNCSAEPIFVTAFQTKADFRKWATDIAWETEVWVADSPDHLIHFNGHKFLGAYST